MVHKIIIISFYLLFIITPLLWAPWNQELFEYNKMMFVYLLTIIITTCWLIKIVEQGKLTIKKTPLDIPILLFLLANILSTIFSIDPHTSIWGYYSRSNGGLLSIISYTLLYFAYVSNFDRDQTIKFLKAALYGGITVALYALPEHFGVSPSCLLLRGNLDAACWIQDVQARVFASLGQPNWLAAYLAMLIFPTLYFLLTSTQKSLRTLYALLLTILYLSFTFTYSRGGTLGFLAGLMVFLIMMFFLFIKGSKGAFLFPIKTLVFLIAAFLLINLIFGSSLTSFKLLNKFSPPSRPRITVQSGTQLENGGDETGNIRLVVWSGAFEIFKHYPVFGSGVETFAYSYYKFRPAAHNLTSEWDFLYNKAHNEFLNYLATTGIVGFAAYMSVILTFIIWSLKKIYKGEHKLSTMSYTLYPLLLASYISYLVSNFFGFSVVIIALYFYLFPGMVFVLDGQSQPYQLFAKINFAFKSLTRKVLFFVIGILAFALTFQLVRFYIADTFYAKGQNYNEGGQTGLAYTTLFQAMILNPYEPLYQSELGYGAAGLAVALKTDDATSSAEYQQEAIGYTANVLQKNPKNVTHFRTAIRTLYLLSTIDPGFQQKTLDLLDQTITLAPTDPKLPYNKALILNSLGKNQAAIDLLNRAISLKPNYRDAHYLLAVIYRQTGNKDQALAEINLVLKINPHDPEAEARTREWATK